MEVLATAGSAIAMFRGKPEHAARADAKIRRMPND
jgi:hypothetical protein